ncbi:MAG: flagellar FlbD family protein, partial [Candidatus Aquilonibacter sp.]
GGAAAPPPPLAYLEINMIALTRLNGHPVMVNSDLIEQIEETPDTVVTLTSGNRLVVRDRMLEIQQKIIDFKRRIYGPG